jgi:hypothetical protein
MLNDQIKTLKMDQSLLAAAKYHTAANYRKQKQTEQIV